MRPCVHARVRACVQVCGCVNVCVCVCVRARTCVSLAFLQVLCTPLCNVCLPVCIAYRQAFQAGSDRPTPAAALSCSSLVAVRAISELQLSAIIMKLRCILLLACFTAAVPLPHACLVSYILRACFRPPRIHDVCQNHRNARCLVTQDELLGAEAGTAVDVIYRGKLSEI